MIETRRQFLLAALMASAALPLALPLAGAAAPVPAPAGGAGPGGERFFLVNGWVLTEADIEMLRQHAS